MFVLSSDFVTRISKKSVASFYVAYNEARYIIFEESLS